MNSASQQLWQSALELPESDRAEIAASLIQSLDKQCDIDSGDAKLVRWDDVMLEMAERRNGP